MPEELVDMYGRVEVTDATPVFREGDAEWGFAGDFVR